MVRASVRQAIADLVDREAIATDVYKGTYTPLYSYIPEGVEGSTTDFKDKYGDGKGGPSVEKATKRLADAEQEAVSIGRIARTVHAGHGQRPGAVQGQFPQSDLGELAVVEEIDRCIARHADVIAEDDRVGGTRGGVALRLDEAG